MKPAQQLCKLLSMVSSLQALSASLLAAKLGVDLKEAERALDILVVLGVVREVSVKGGCNVCPLSRFCGGSRTTSCRFYVVNAERLRELQKRCEALGG